MKICYIAPTDSIHTQRWVMYFADRGHEVHLISFEPLGDGDIGRTELHILKRCSLRVKIVSSVIDLVPCVIQVRNLLKKINPDILHAHYITDNGLLGVLSGFHPLVIRAMGSDVLVEPKRYPLLKPLIEYALKKADLITCHGENVLERIVELGAKREKIKVIGLGVDTEKFSPLGTNKSFIKKELGLFDSPTIISTRGLKPIYDIETLIKAIPLVLERVPDAKFVIAGRGPQEDYLKGLSKSLGVLDSTRFVGWIAHDELPTYLAAADVYVSTSLSDSGPVSTLEAMACELPVVATDSGEHRNWVKDGINGFIISKRSTEELASKVIYLLEDEDNRDIFGKANRPVAVERAYYKKEIEKLEKLYEELIAKRNTD